MADTEAPGTTASEAASDEAVQASAETTEAPVGGATEGQDIEALKAELAELKAQMADALTRRTEAAPAPVYPPTNEGPGPEDALRQQMDEIAQQAAQINAEIEVLATRGNDPVAKAAILQRKQMQVALQATALSIQQMREAVYLHELPEADRAAFKTFVASNRHRYADMDAAYEGFLGQRYKQERASLARKERAATEVVRRAQEGIVGTGTREVPAAEMRQRAGVTQMTEEAFDNKVEQLRAAGDFEGARKLQRDHTDGRIQLT